MRYAAPCFAAALLGACATTNHDGSSSTTDASPPSTAGQGGAVSSGSLGGMATSPATGEGGAGATSGGAGQGGGHGGVGGAGALGGAGGVGGFGGAGFGGATTAASSTASTTAASTTTTTASSTTTGGGTVTATPCASGPGSTLWRVSWPSNGGGYATVEAWDNGCTYSLADQACSLSGEPHDDANWGPGVVLNSSTDFFRVRFSVQGLSFTTATLYVSAHADGSGIPNGLLQSPLYGDLTFAPQVPISQHQTYAIDWSSYLDPSDPPSLTAVTLRSMPVGLAVSAMELCAE